MAALSRFLLLIAALTFGGRAMAADLENTLYMDVPAGRVVIETVSYTHLRAHET